MGRGRRREEFQPQEPPVKLLTVQCEAVEEDVAQVNRLPSSCSCARLRISNCLSESVTIGLCRWHSGLEREGGWMTLRGDEVVSLDTDMHSAPPQVVHTEKLRTKD